MTEQVIGTISRRNDRLFYLGVALAIIVFVFVGFAPSYYLRAYFDAPALTPLLHLHGFIFSAWLVVFLAQAMLVATGRVSVHRRLGTFGVGLAVFMLIVGMATLLEMAPHSPDPATSYAVAIGDLVMFAAFVSTAVYLRRRSESHKRLMVLALVAILPAGVGRWPMLLSIDNQNLYLITTYTITNLVIAVGIFFDLMTQKGLQPAYVWGGIALLLSQFVRVVIRDTAAWETVTAALLTLG